MCTYVSGDDVSIPNICIPKIKDLIFLLDLGLETFLPKKRLLLNLFSTYLLKSPPQGNVFGDLFQFNRDRCCRFKLLCALKIMKNSKQAKSFYSLWDTKICKQNLFTLINC